MVRVLFAFMSSFDSLQERPVCEHFSLKCIKSLKTQQKKKSYQQILNYYKTLCLRGKKSSIGHSIKLPFLPKFSYKTFFMH